MLYKDDVKIDLKDTSGIAQKCNRILLRLKEKANAKGVVRFKTLPAMKNPALFIPLQATVKTPDGSYVITYAENVLRKGDQIVYMPATLRWPASGQVNINKDPELAVFLYGFSTLCLNGKNANKSNVCWFMLEDTEKEAEVLITSRKVVSRVTTLVLETIEYGGAPLKLVLDYAKSKGMRFSDMESEKVVRSNILTTIEKLDLYQDFMATLNSRDFFLNNELLDEAVAQGVLKVTKLSTSSNEKAWRWIDEKGIAGDIICKLPVKSNARAKMLEQMDQNPYLSEELKERVGFTAEEAAKPTQKGRDFPIEPATEMVDHEEKKEDDYGDPSKTDSIVLGPTGPSGPVGVTADHPDILPAAEDTEGSTPVVNKGGRPKGSRNKGSGKNKGKR